MRLAMWNWIFAKKRTEISGTIEKKCPIQTENRNDNLPSKAPARDLIAFWILGLCTEFGYILMICAAFDILHRFDDVCISLPILIKCFLNLFLHFHCVGERKRK